MKDMIKSTYKPGKDILSRDNKNNYHQFYWFGSNLKHKGYYNNGKFIKYQESYTKWKNKGLKYII